MPLLFSYGTLQQEGVQLATFGRRLVGQADELLGYKQTWVKIEDPDVLAISEKTHHPMVQFTGESQDRIGGTMFEISDDELALADKYEVAAYKRVAADFVSGRRAWVYVDANGV